MIRSHNWIESLESRRLMAATVAGTVSFATLGSGAYAAGDVNSCSIATNNLFTDVKSGKQFAAYYDTAGKIIIGRRAVGGTTWQTYASGISVPTADLGDDHNVISIAVDSAGYLHMSWDMHNVTLNYAVSTVPVTGPSLPAITLSKKTIANAPSLFSNGGATTNEVTYPQFYSIPNSANLLFVYRNGGAGGGSGNGNQYFDVYSPATKTWTNKLVIDGEKTNVNAYLNNLVFDSSGNLQMSWTWRDTPNWQTNSNIMYARSPDNGSTWFRQGGGQYTLPIIQSGTPAAAVGQVVKTIPQGSSFINQTSMAVDAAANPYVATYMAPGYNPATKSGNPNRQYVLTYFSGGQWRTSQISTRASDTAIDPSGANVRDLGRPVVLVDKQGRVLVVTRSQNTAMGAYKNHATAGNNIVVYYSTNLSSASPTWGSVAIDAANMGAYEPTFDAVLWTAQNKLSLFYEPVGLAGQTSATVRTLDWDEAAYFAPTPTPTTYQAESGTAGGGTNIAKSISGYTGTGYADFNKTGGYVNWANVAAPSAGTRTLTFRYALDASASRTVQLQVNGVTLAGGVTFAPTGAWEKWASVSVSVALNAGLNTVRLTSIGQDGGNLDALTVT